MSSLDSELNGDNDDEDDNMRLSISSATYSAENYEFGPKSAFHLILQRSSLARSMKSVFEELCSTGKLLFFWKNMTLNTKYLFALFNSIGSAED